MAFPVAEELVADAEKTLGRTFPPAHRARLLRDNGGDVLVNGSLNDDPWWQLHPVRDTSDRKRLKRTMADVITETENARAWRSFPAGAISVAENGTADRIILNSDGTYGWWDHETGDVKPVTVIWDD